MPFYHKLGDIPHKRHTQFKKKDGTLYSEELMGTRGFSGIQSTLYHIWPPTKIKESSFISKEQVQVAQNLALEPRLIDASTFKSSGDPITSREWMLINSDVKIGLSTPTAEMRYFYRNASCDELLFIHYGKGQLLSQFGNLDFESGDYVVIPVGTTYQIKTLEECKILTIESRGRIEVPKRYRNEYGQFNEFSPFCERDIRLPTDLRTHDESGSFELRIKLDDCLHIVTLAHHPFDVVGWDGFLYPWVFNIRDFEPITGRIHQPPPVHQTFYSDGFVVCSFCPRMYDYHPLSIPVPYNHSNVNSDEVLYYVEGNFMSRKGVKSGTFSLHPAGIPHGPHPGTVEKSLTEKETKELAVMVDTFAPLHLTQKGLDLSDLNYAKSWL